MKIKLIKISELPNALHPNNIVVGHEVVRSVDSELFKPPELGERFWLGWFSTSEVREIVDENTFKTWSSIYKWEKLEDE